MFAGIPYVMGWLIIRMIGRFKERRSFCDGETSPGRRVYPSVAADMFCRRRQVIELWRGMQRPSVWGGATLDAELETLDA